MRESLSSRLVCGLGAVVVAMSFQSCAGEAPKQGATQPQQPSLLQQGQPGGPDGQATPKQAPPDVGQTQGGAFPRGSLLMQPTPQQGGGEEDGFVTTETGLQFKDLEPGQGPQPRYGQTVTVHYIGWLTDGTKFDSSVDKGQPFQFVLGAREVIQGWDQGVSTMRVGGVRRLVVPPHLAYGDRGAGGVIPPGATLVFDVKLLGVQ